MVAPPPPQNVEFATELCTRCERTSLCVVTDNSAARPRILQVRVFLSPVHSARACSDAERSSSSTGVQRPSALAAIAASQSRAGVLINSRWVNIVTLSVAGRRWRVLLVRHAAGRRLRPSLPPSPASPDFVTPMTHSVIRFPAPTRGWPV